MKKMEFMRYAATEIAAYCGNLYRIGKIANFTARCDYTRVSINIKKQSGVIELVFYSSGRIIVKGRGSDGYSFEISYYEWAEATATENIAVQLQTSLLAAVSEDNVCSMEAHFRPTSQQEK